MTNRRQVQQERMRQQRRAEREAARKRRNLQIVAAVLTLAVAGVGIGVAATSGDNGSSSSSVEQTTSTAEGTSPASVDAVPAGRTITGDTPCPPADGSAERASSFEKAPPMCIDPAKRYRADFDTNQGHILVDLDASTTPGTTNNFVVLSRYKFYDGTAIFRIDPSIDIVQGGGPSTQSPSDPGPGYTIKDEYPTTNGGKFSYTTGDLVMARTNDPNSAGAEYFFGTGPKVANLNSSGTYVKFGHVAQGQDVLTKIMGMYVADPSSGLGGGPKDPVIVNHITITEQ